MLLNDDKSGTSLLENLQSAPESKRQELLLKSLGTIVRSLLDDDSSEEIDPQQRIFELGLGSLLIVEFKARLDQEFSVDLPVTLFFKYSSLEELTTYLLDEVLHLPREKPTHSADQHAGSTLREPLSDQDTEAKVLEKIAQLQQKFEL